MITVKQVEKMIENAQEHKDVAKADGSSNYYYWDGYINALESIVSGLPDFDQSLEDNWWNAIK